jgi:hypothetical protein
MYRTQLDNNKPTARLSARPNQTVKFRNLHDVCQVPLAKHRLRSETLFIQYDEFENVVICDWLYVNHLASETQCNTEPVSHLLLDFTIIPTPPFTLHPTLAAWDDPFLTSVVQHHEHGENKKFLGSHSANRPADAIIAAILHQRYCLVPCTIDPGGRFGRLTSSLLWPRKRHPSAIRPPSRSIRGLPPARVPANNAACLASRSLLDFGILPKADQGWHEAHGDHFWFTRDYSATLPSHWAKQILGRNLLVGLDFSLRHWPFPRPSRFYPIYPTSLSPNRRCSSPRPPTQLRFGLRFLFPDEFGHDSID